jgi:hypothetical protein
MSGAHEEHDGSKQAGSERDKPIRYPVDRVVAVLDTAPQVKTAAEALRAGGFLDSEINVTSGAAAADALDDATGRTGLAGLAVRIAEKLGIEDIEMERKTKYENAMRDGKFVVAVLAPSDERKKRATQILREFGAHTANYFGKYTIEGLIPPR